MLYNLNMGTLFALAGTWGKCVFKCVSFKTKFSEHLAIKFKIGEVFWKIRTFISHDIT